jgi:dGTPase
MARVIHGGAFRRLQGKTQVMGAGEGDFHRTRLTHSLEVHQIGRSLFHGKLEKENAPSDLTPYLENAGDVISTACYAHDLGHPPFGHGGERALHQKMHACGGFEGNAQTIRILTKLEKYTERYGINPTRRTLLSVLKYPVCYSAYPTAEENKKPPKCYYIDEHDIISWLLKPFSNCDKEIFTALSEKNKPQYKSLDASIMECADDIAYSTHDLEDSVARKFLDKDIIISDLECFFNKNGNIDIDGGSLKAEEFCELFSNSVRRKKFTGKLVNIMMTTTSLQENRDFSHPLLRYNLKIHEQIKELIDFITDKIIARHVIKTPKVQMLELKGQRIIKKLFEELSASPEQLITNWNDGLSISKERKICDYIAGMTDSYAVKIYNRLFTPGQGTSTDEL